MHHAATCRPQFVRVCVLSALIALMVCAEAHAFLYCAPVGSTKDNCVIWNDGTYYLYTMYRKERQIGDVLDQWRHVWCATSKDGVHWEDVGPVIEDAPFIIFAMRVWKAGDRFIMDHGSFTDNRQDVLRFWESEDLIHWKYLGPDYDVRRPDGERIDHMDVVKIEENGKDVYYGYAVGGVLRSEDGVKWDWLSDFAFTDSLRVRVVQEPGGCERIGNTFYLLVGGFYPGSFGYAVTTFKGESPTGPFAPDYPAFRLTGNSGRKTVALWAGYCRKPDELLLINYMLDPGGLFWWHAPLKKAVVDEGGHLHMGYWHGNDALKGETVALDPAQCRSVCPASDESPVTESGAIHLRAEPLPSLRWLNPNKPSRALALLDTVFDVDTGVIIEGTLRVSPIHTVVFPAIGLYLEEEAQKGKLILFETWEQTETGTYTWAGEPRFDVEDQVAVGCATVAGLPSNKTCTFRVLYRKNIFEVYLDDHLVQTYSAESPTGRIGFLVQDGDAVVGDLQAWAMNLER